MGTIKTAIRTGLRNYLPLSARKRLAVLINRQPWLNRKFRAWISSDLLQNWKDSDVNSLHKFQWENHLGYASTYEIDARFGYDNFNETRKILFNELQRHLRDRGLNPASDIHSVFEVGCSLGYLLRYMETDLFPNADYLGGIDIDQYAIDRGSAYLQGLDSKVELIRGDMESLEQVMQSRSYDIVFCPGVLMYLQQEHAKGVVDVMLKHSKKLLCITGLAHPTTDNSQLTASCSREIDRTFIHNIDKMVVDSGGQILYRRWDGDRIVDGNTIYFVFAEKQS